MRKERERRTEQQPGTGPPEGIKDTVRLAGERKCRGHHTPVWSPGTSLTDQEGRKWTPPTVQISPRFPFEPSTDLHYHPFPPHCAPLTRDVSRTTDHHESSLSGSLPVSALCYVQRGVEGWMMPTPSLPATSKRHPQVFVLAGHPAALGVERKNAPGTGQVQAHRLDASHPIPTRLPGRNSNFARTCSSSEDEEGGPAFTTALMYPSTPADGSSTIRFRPGLRRRNAVAHDNGAVSVIPSGLLDAPRRVRENQPSPKPGTLLRLTIFFHDKGERFGSINAMRSFDWARSLCFFGMAPSYTLVAWMGDGAGRSIGTISDVLMRFHCDDGLGTRHAVVYLTSDSAACRDQGARRQRPSRKIQSGTSMIVRGLAARRLQPPATASLVDLRDIDTKYKPEFPSAQRHVLFSPGPPHLQLPGTSTETAVKEAQRGYPGTADAGKKPPQAFSSTYCASPPHHTSLLHRDRSSNASWHKRGAQTGTPDAALPTGNRLAGTRAAARGVEARSILAVPNGQIFWNQYRLCHILVLDVRRKFPTSVYSMAIIVDGSLQRATPYQHQMKAWVNQRQVPNSAVPVMYFALAWQALPYAEASNEGHRKPGLDWVLGSWRHLLLPASFRWPGPLLILDPLPASALGFEGPIYHKRGTIAGGKWSAGLGCMLAPSRGGRRRSWIMEENSELEVIPKAHIRGRHVNALGENGFAYLSCTCADFAKPCGIRGEIVNMNRLSRSARVFLSAISCTHSDISSFETDKVRDAPTRTHRIVGA
ncbi:uncharacterized protein CLUP02_03471 [Colletotrichum lupini]|uniref:Uncharacterized protein n=1 Tax=Colletotrichum lupini TaxID=145971 RepID=A0A9Q8SIX1_9PEZI|nr:uncharacterized protein CLUP02_03471 [Colletotrichum lupini]UQC77998.1 hypothetical protein CLUP02_03471 [Colletotrichum lupini]